MKKEELQLLIAEGEGLTVEFKQKYTQKIVQDIVAFSNTRGGKILLGVTDAGTIQGEKLTNKMKAEIVDFARNCDPSIYVSVKQVENLVVVDVPTGEEPPYQCSHGYFKRLDGVTQKLRVQEVRKFFKDYQAKIFEGTPAKNCTLADISLEKVKSFFDKTKADVKVTQANLKEVLHGLGLYENNQFTHAATLMFAKNVRKFVFHAETICVAFKDEKRIHIYDRRDVRDDLIFQFNAAIEFFRKHLNVRSEIEGIKREDIYEIPLPVIREAVANALIHRNYAMTGTSIYVEVYPKKIRIVNPGGLPSSIKKGNLGTKVVSFRRNDMIADLFNRMDIVERVGTGLMRLQERLKKAGLKPAKFNLISNSHFFEIERPEEYRSLRKKSTTLEPLPKKNYPRNTTQEKLNKTALSLIELMRKNPEITQNEMAHQAGITLDGVKYHLRRLQKANLVRHTGATKRGRWEVLC